MQIVELQSDWLTQNKASELVKPRKCSNFTRPSPFVNGAGDKTINPIACMDSQTQSGEL